MDCLKGKILAITRSEAEAQEFIDLVNTHGGRTIALRTIEIVPYPPSIIDEFLLCVSERRHEFCAFMSSQAVNVMIDHAQKINKLDKLISTLRSMTIIAIGPKTKQKLNQWGVDVNIVPEHYSSIGLVDLFSKSMYNGTKIIIPRSEASNEFAVKRLRNLGMIVDELYLYSVKSSLPDRSWRDFITLLEDQKIAAIVFTSSSAVKSFFEIAQKLVSYDLILRLNGTPAVVSIGPFTTDELKKRGLKVFEAREHTIRGTFELVMELVKT